MLRKKIKRSIRGVYPFHMPGHKRNPEFLKNYAPLDVTETEDTDNLLAPRGVIKYAQRETSNLFCTKQTFYITSGSTTAILSAVKSVTKAGDRIVFARNCHKSVWAAAELLRLKTDYIYPETNSTLGTFGEINPIELDKLLSVSPASAVVITSPTYEGILCDINAIAQIVHKYGALLIVDAAHGAHLGFSDAFPKSARTLGADIVVESAHKTLPCLTGAAMLHICSDRVNINLVSEAIGIFQSSSPSYPIMYSLDDMTSLIKRRGKTLFTSYNKKLEKFYKKCSSLKHIFIYKGEDTFSYDKGKLCIVTSRSNIDGYSLKELLRRKKISLEMASAKFCLAMTSIADTNRGFNRLFSALKSIDKKLCPNEQTFDFKQITPSREFSLYEAKEQPSVYIMSGDAEGKTAGEYIFAYPPGSPIIAPGEIITSETIYTLETLSSLGAEVYSSSGEYPDKIKVLKK